MTTKDLFLFFLCLVGYSQTDDHPIQCKGAEIKVTTIHCKELSLVDFGGNRVFLPAFVWKETLGDWSEYYIILDLYIFSFSHCIVTLDTKIAHVRDIGVCAICPFRAIVLGMGTVVCSSGHDWRTFRSSNK